MSAVSSRADLSSRQIIALLAREDRGFYEDEFLAALGKYSSAEKDFPKAGNLIHSQCARLSLP